MRKEVLIIRNTIYEAIDDFFRKKEFCEVSPPILTPFSCEVACVGGSDLISVDYYGKKAFLTQSGQLYLEALALQLKQVYCIAPAFRAESTLLTTHLSEFWMCEAEVLNSTFDELVETVKALLLSVIQAVLQKNSFELQILGVNIDSLKRILCKSIQIVTYTKAIEILKNNSVLIDWGDDIEPAHEVILSKYFDDVPIIITRYPRKLSSFYKKVCLDNPELTLSFDVIAPNGYREIVGGSLRETNVEVLVNALQSAKANLAQYEWYLDLISQNPHEHGGFGLGIERLVSWICNLDTIQDAIPFPRTEDNICP